MPTLYYGHVMNGENRMHYYRTGGQKPPLLFIHGLSDSGLSWSRTSIALGPDYDTIMVDLRAHGLSGIGDGQPAIDASALDIAELIRSLELGKVILVGHSIGATIAAVTAQKFPDLINGMILEDPPWFSHETNVVETEYEKVMSIWNSNFQRWKSSSFEELINLIREEHPGWEEDEQFQWVKAKQQLRPEFLNYLGRMPFKWESVTDSVKTRTLILAGDPAEGGLLTIEIKEMIKKKWKNALIVSIPRVGHNIRRDDPITYYQEVRKFLGGFKIKNGLFR